MEADGFSKLALILAPVHLEIEEINKKLVILVSLFVKYVFCNRGIVKDVFCKSRQEVDCVKELLECLVYKKSFGQGCKPCTFLI